MNGKVGIVGGSEEYTGAPYYAAVSSLRSGGDLVYVFTPSERALVPIKCYSPEIIVHYVPKPKNLISWMNALHSIVIGPGLGRSDELNTYLGSILSEVSQNRPSIKLVLDADALFFVSSAGGQHLIDNLKQLSNRAYLTPNKVEFGRLLKCFNLDQKYNILNE
jgi:ATP-dependent NAD(P)H-hydrate dehydratase